MTAFEGAVLGTKARFAVKVLAYVAVSNLLALPVVWLANIHYAVVFAYEGIILVILGGIQFLLSCVYYVKDHYSTLDQKYPYPGPSMLDLKRLFKRLTREERSRYRQEGMVMMTIGVALCLAAALVYLSRALH